MASVTDYGAADDPRSGATSLAAWAAAVSAALDGDDTSVDSRIAAAGAGGYDVILLAGQSNMVGTGTGYTLASDPVVPGVFQLKQDGSIVAATEPLDHIGTDYFGPGLTFARWYVASGANAGRDVLLVPAAQNSTPLVSATAPTWNPATSGSLYDAAVTRVNAAIADTPGSRVAAILWAQGETDGVGSVAEATYSAALVALVAAFRADLTDATDVPFIVGGMVPELLSTAAFRAINNAHVALPNQSLLCGFAPGVPGYQTDTYHYTTPSYREMGRRLFDAYLQAVTGLGSQLRWGGFAQPVAALSVTSDVMVATATFSGGNYDGQAVTTWDIYWGDGDATTDATSGVTHTYSGTGNYVVRAVADSGTLAGLVVTQSVSISATPAVITYAGGATGGSGSSWTLSGVALGTAAADRVMIVHISGYEQSATTSPTVTVAGVSVTIEHFERGSGTWSAIGRAAVPTGATGDVVVSTSAAQYSIAVALYAATGTSTLVDYVATTTTSSGQLTVASGQVMLGLFYSSRSGTLTWTGATADYSLAAAGNVKMNGAHTSTPGATTFSVSDSFATPTAMHFLAATYGPA